MLFRTGADDIARVVRLSCCHARKPRLLLGPASKAGLRQSCLRIAVSPARTSMVHSPPGWNDNGGIPNEYTIIALLAGANARRRERRTQRAHRTTHCPPRRWQSDRPRPAQDPALGAPSRAPPNRVTSCLLASLWTLSDAHARGISTPAAFLAPVRSQRALNPLHCQLLNCRVTGCNF